MDLHFRPACSTSIYLNTGAGDLTHQFTVHSYSATCSTKHAQRHRLLTGVMFHVQCLQANAEKRAAVPSPLQNRSQIPKRYKAFSKIFGTFRLHKGNFHLFSRFLSLFLPLSNKRLTLHFHLHPPASPGRGVAIELLPTGHCDAGNFQLFPSFQQGSCVLFTLFSLLCKDDNLSNHLRARDGSRGVSPVGCLADYLKQPLTHFSFI